MQKKKLVTEQDILNLIFNNKNTLQVIGNELFTPAAIDKIKETGILLEKVNSVNEDQSNNLQPFNKLKKLAIGCDHTGFDVKKILIDLLKSQGFEIIDVGTYDKKSCDYPDFAIKVAKLVQSSEVYFGIIIDATGIPSAITANKIKGIRAATCYNEFTAKSSREHNNSNILVLGAKALGEETIKSIINVWLDAKFLGERHQRRLDKITELEK